jgi:hypothetical protein
MTSEEPGRQRHRSAERFQRARWQGDNQAAHLTASHLREFVSDRLEVPIWLEGDVWPHHAKGKLGERRQEEKSNSSSSLLSVRRLSAVGRHNARHRQPSQNRRQLYQHLNRMALPVAKTETNRAYTHWRWPKVFAPARYRTLQRCRINRHALACLLYVGARSRDLIALDFARD